MLSHILNFRSQIEIGLGMLTLALKIWGKQRGSGEQIEPPFIQPPALQPPETEWARPTVQSAKTLIHIKYQTY